MATTTKIKDPLADAKANRLRIIQQAGATGSNVAHNNLQPYFTTRFIIKY